MRGRRDERKQMKEKVHKRGACDDGGAQGANRKRQDRVVIS